jgi:hypothetical protein
MAHFIHGESHLPMLVEALEYIRDNCSEASSMGVGVHLPRALQALQQLNPATLASPTKAAATRGAAAPLSPGRAGSKAAQDATLCVCLGWRLF